MAEVWGYASAFWMGALVNAFGVIFFFTHVRKTFERDRLR